MYPLLFIVLLTIALVILTYLTLAWNPGKERGLVRPGRWLAFEAAPELFKYVEPDLYLAPNSLKLTRLSPTRISAYWRLSSDKYPKGERNNKDLTDEGQLVLRLYRSGELLEIEDVIVNKTSGSRTLELSEDLSCCASLGIKKGEHFTPLMFSNTLMHQLTMQSHHRSRV